MVAQSVRNPLDCEFAGAVRDIFDRPDACDGADVDNSGLLFEYKWQKSVSDFEKSKDVHLVDAPRVLLESAHRAAATDTCVVHQADELFTRFFDPRSDLR